MKIYHHAQSLQADICELISQKKTIHFIPTMGQLHQGHLSLIEKAYKTIFLSQSNENAVIVVSIFVNPTQFHRKEDYDLYQLNLDSDYERLKTIILTYAQYPIPFLVFVPEKVTEMYPHLLFGKDSKRDIQLMPGSCADLFCGEYRPGHFSGVLSVILKFFHLIQPHFAYFGKKDLQQLFCIKQLVKEYFLPIQIIEVETFRQQNLLPLSSRNSRLKTQEQQQAAIHFSQFLNDFKFFLHSQPLNTEIFCQALQYLENRDQNDLWKWEYVGLVFTESFLPIFYWRPQQNFEIFHQYLNLNKTQTSQKSNRDNITFSVALLGAGYVDNEVRLIDNHIFSMNITQEPKVSIIK